MPSAGSIESVSFAGREFAVASDADATVAHGGFTNEVQTNGNGTARKIMSRVPWSVDGLQLQVDPANGDQEFLQERADAGDFEIFSLTYVDGATYQGTGTVTGDLQRSTQSGTASVAFQGPGQLTKQ